MHQSVATWVTDLVGRYHLEDLPTLEIGAGDPSNNGEGQRLAELFEDYTACDKLDLPGQLTWDIELGPVPGYAVVLCTEVLEHVQRPWRAIDNMAQSLVPNGVLILTARGYDLEGCAPVHGPEDYWRFSPQAIRTMLEDSGLEVMELEPDWDPLWRGVLSLSKRR